MSLQTQEITNIRGQEILQYPMIPKVTTKTKRKMMKTIQIYKKRTRKKSRKRIMYEKTVNSGKRNQDWYLRGRMTGKFKCLCISMTTNVIKIIKPRPIRTLIVRSWRGNGKLLSVATRDGMKTRNTIKQTSRYPSFRRSEDTDILLCFE